MGIGTDENGVAGSTARLQENTAAGCRERASAERARSSPADTQNQREVIERSAASWAKRADLLQDEEDNAGERRAAAAEDWAEEDRQEARFQAPDDAESDQ
jgi:hypothetical protein